MSLYTCVDVFERWAQGKIIDITDVFENKDTM